MTEPIRAEISKSTQCDAEGYTVKTSASVRGGTTAARARAPSSVAAPLPSPSTKKTAPKVMRDDRADRVAIDDRDHARPLVLPQQRIVVRRADSAASPKPARGALTIDNERLTA
jgi:hypothetical protein